MGFELPKYIEPNFEQEFLKSAPNVKTEEVVKEGVAPENYHGTTIFPEYFKIDGKWVLAKESRMDSVVVVKDNNEVEVKEFRNLKVGEKVVVGRTEDASEGIYVYNGGFVGEEEIDETFAFRSGRSRETAYSKDYDDLYEVLRREKEHGYIVWVLGPAAVFDKDAREAMAALIDNGYVHAFLGGNAVATHDLEAATIGTALGQDIYTQKSMKDGHYNHLDLLNKARRAGSIERLIEEENITDGIIHACVKNDVPIVLGGSIRDDGPLPIVISDVYKAQNEMRKHTRKATTVICLATQLHSIATGNMTPSYTVVNGEVRPVFIYSVDVSEFAVNKLRDRGTLEVKTIVTNVQDFLVNLKNNLTK
ncbi:putative NPN-dependent ornithine cyclodeaminase [Tepidibacter formicigenes]|jgi:lysine-ketoglutarate reductase/saccharopine dehydrogenase-like protein (TIGR00300 family)|uniref:TIGR00300 family protein n=1 Tax=Tepidibacter formicigenes DSM 15518 TaxID=1123349 RepID=A0A1M6KQL9_9FIRM|nr:hypothetical protein [Tepidibacter formicigenes]SHJ61196.1 TIGR00300 family protein [Tepidibacter formicigenes DSM 15518]